MWRWIFVLWSWNRSIENYFSSFAQFSGLGLHISFNIGVPLFKSTYIQLWSILCSVKGSEPFVVDLFCGIWKQDSLDTYLSDFLNEFGEVKRKGVSYNDETLSISFSAFVLMLQPDPFWNVQNLSMDTMVVKGVL